MGAGNRVGRVRIAFRVRRFRKTSAMAHSCNIKSERPQLKKDALPTKFWYHGENPPKISPSKLYQKLRPVERKKLIREASTGYSRYLKFQGTSKITFRYQ